MGVRQTMQDAQCAPAELSSAHFSASSVSAHWRHSTQCPQSGCNTSRWAAKQMMQPPLSSASPAPVVAASFACTGGGGNGSVERRDRRRLIV